MKIEKLIGRLEEIQKMYPNKDVYIYLDTEDFAFAIESVEVDEFEQVYINI